MSEQRFMYVGPTIPGVAARNTVYEGTPEPLAAAIRAAPYMTNLCLPVPAVADAMKQITRRQGGIYSAFARTVMESAAIQAEIQKGEE